MPKNKVEPDGYACRDIFGRYDTNTFSPGHFDCVARSNLRRGGKVGPIFFCSPEEKSRIVPQALLDWVEREREILKLGGQKYLDELNKIWPEPEEP